MWTAASEALRRVRPAVQSPRLQVRKVKMVWSVTMLALSSHGMTNLQDLANQEEHDFDLWPIRSARRYHGDTGQC